MKTTAWRAAAWLAALGAAAIATWPACARAGAADAAAERATIARQRQALLARFAVQEAECRQHFVVTACVDALREQRDRSMRALR
ncbi:MAG: hypothetical protein KGK09_10995, partial [Burkholderiales bacterium]|nr:hypothetical protein [Burkholderiales bacterium]